MEVHVFYVGAILIAEAIILVLLAFLSMEVAKLEVNWKRLNEKLSKGPIQEDVHGYQQNDTRRNHCDRRNP